MPPTRKRPSLTFKGPTDSKRIRKPTNLIDPIVPTATTKVKNKGKTVANNKPRLSQCRDEREVAKERQEVIEEVNEKKKEMVSGKLKGKRKRFDEEDQDENQPLETNEPGRLKPFDINVNVSTVEKNWKLLSKTSRNELQRLTKQVEREFMLELTDQGYETSNINELLSRFSHSFLSSLENLPLPPFPSTLKPRTTTKKPSQSGVGEEEEERSKIDLIDRDYVETKIISLRKNLENQREEEGDDESEGIQTTTNRKEKPTSTSIEIVEGPKNEEEVIEEPPCQPKKKKKVVKSTVSSSPATDQQNEERIDPSKPKKRASLAGKIPKSNLSLSLPPSPSISSSKPTISKDPPKKTLQKKKKRVSIDPSTTVSSSLKNNSVHPRGQKPPQRRKSILKPPPPAPINLVRKPPTTILDDEHDDEVENDDEFDLVARKEKKDVGKPRSSFLPFSTVDLVIESSSISRRDVVEAKGRNEKKRGIDEMTKKGKRGGEKFEKTKKEKEVGVAKKKVKKRVEYVDV